MDMRGIDRLPDWARKFVDKWIELRLLFILLPDTAKFASILTVKSLAVSAFLSLLATPATAIYSVRFGLRVPVEGVPYISFTIALWSFIGFSISIVMATVIVAILLYLREIIRSFSISNFMPYSILLKFLFFSDTVQRYKVYEMRFKIYFKEFVSKYFLSISIAIFSFSCFSVALFEFGFDIFFNYVTSLYFLSAVFFSAWYSLAGRPLWMLQGYLTAPLLIIMTMLLFVPDSYGSLLRVIRYGGGLSSTMKLNGITIDGSSDEIVGYLVLRSDTSLFILNDSDYIYEIPSSKVEYIKFRFDADWKMPAYGLAHQKRYIHIE